MSHWAEINKDNIVLRVTVGDNNDPIGDEGYQWLIDNLGGTWIKTSYNTLAGVHREGGTPLRKNFAGIGFTYDAIRDAFIPPKPKVTDENDNPIDVNWILDEDTCLWKETPGK
jgi:hypothetical protein